MLVLLTGVPGKKAKPGELYPSATGLGCGNAHFMKSLHPKLSNSGDLDTPL